VHVNVCNDGEFPLLADFPKRPEMGAIKLNDAGVEAVGIDVVVKDKIHHSHAPAHPEPKQEGTAFPSSTAAALT